MEVVAVAATPVTPVVPAPTALVAEKPWYADIPDEGLRGYAELKHWATPADAIKGAQSAEKLIGVPAEQILRLPKADAPPEERMAMYDRLGRPKTPEDYKLAVPEGGDPEFAKMMAPMLHKNGITAEQAKGLNADWNATVTQMVTQAEEAKSLKSQAELEDVKREWGGKYNERVELARRGSALLGLTSEEDRNAMEDAIGTARMMKILADLGEKLGEDKFEPGNGNGAGFGMTPAAAKVKMEQLMTDPEWAKGYRDGGMKSAQYAEYQRLLKIANP